MINVNRVVVEYTDNHERVFWIREKKISNKHKGRVYPTQVSDITTPRSVAVYYIDELGERKQIAQLACVDYRLLKQKYEDGDFINLNYTYIDDFSWYGTNRFYEIDESQFRKLKGFSAYCSFWNGENLGDKLVNLMQLNITNEDVCFDYSIFNRMVFCLTNVNIHKGSLYFDNARFLSADVSLMGISCNKNLYDNPTISMNNTEFKNSSVELFQLKDHININFLSSEMTNTKVEINNTRGSIGTVCLTKAKLDKFFISHCKIGGIDSRNSDINILSLMGCELNGLSEIELASNYELSFSACLLNSILKLDIHQNSKSIRFDSTINNGRIYFKSFSRIMNSVLNGVKETDDINQLLMLKENFRSLGEYEHEDLCYSKYRKMENELHEKNIFNKCKNYLTLLISDYGTKPFRLFMFILGLIFGFSLLYYVCPIIMFQHATTFIDYVYVSGITFFTVGYGDILPLNSISKIVVLFEAFLGVTTMSYFLVVLSRKIIR